jgi:Flp pilus assembly protein TadB
MSIPGGPDRKVADMLSKEDNRRLAQLERQLRRQDPEFCARMLSGGHPTRGRRPVALAIIGVTVWIATLVFSVVGWWLVAAACALWATLIVCALACRWRPARPTDPEPLPPTW